MTENKVIEVLKQPCNCDYDLSATIESCDISKCDRREAVMLAIKALEEIQKYRAIGTVEKCLQNKDFLDFLADKMNPNDFEIYLRLYNALKEKGCE